MTSASSELWDCSEKHFSVPVNGSGWADDEISVPVKCQWSYALSRLRSVCQALQLRSGLWMPFQILWNPKSFWGFDAHRFEWHPISSSRCERIASQFVARCFVESIQVNRNLFSRLFPQESSEISSNESSFKWARSKNQQVSDVRLNVDMDRFLLAHDI